MSLLLLQGMITSIGALRRAYEVTGLPTSYIIGKDGQITGKVFGARDWDGVESIRLFETLLNPRP